MSAPEFNPDERYIIALYESDFEWREWVDWLIHFAMIALFAFGVLVDEPSILATAFAVVIIWRIYESVYRPRLLRATRGVLAKYKQFVEEHMVSRGGDE